MPKISFLLDAFTFAICIDFDLVVYRVSLMKLVETHAVNWTFILSEWLALSTDNVASFLYVK